MVSTTRYFVSGVPTMCRIEADGNGPPLLAFRICASDQWGAPTTFQPPWPALACSWALQSIHCPPAPHSDRPAALGAASTMPRETPLPVDARRRRLSLLIGEGVGADLAYPAPHATSRRPGWRPLVRREWMEAREPHRMAVRRLMIGPSRCSCGGSGWVVAGWGAGWGCCVGLCRVRIGAGGSAAGQGADGDRLAVPSAWQTPFVNLLPGEGDPVSRTAVDLLSSSFPGPGHLQQLTLGSGTRRRTRPAASRARGGTGGGRGRLRFDRQRAKGLTVLSCRWERLFHAGVQEPSRTDPWSRASWWRHRWTRP